MPKRILLVEDDRAISRGLEMNLQLEGYEVTTAFDGKTGLELALEHEYELIVLDLMLPHLHGYQVCQKIRRTGSVVPIVILSAKSAEMDKIMGLDLGADDYVTKPFSLGELLARIRVLLRRHSPDDKVTFSDVVVDLEARAVWRDGKLVELTQREFDLLSFFISREGRALTRDTILAGVWDQHYFGTDRTVDNFITRLRQKLDTPKRPSHFLTVRGVGYRFVLDPST